MDTLEAVDVPAALAEHAAVVEEAIDTLLPLPDGQERRLVEAMRYATLGGGKRMRGFLVMEVAGLFGVARTSAARVAASVEMLHAYSLVHDDLPAMDDDDLRRGRPTSHKQFGEDVAILAGDGLFAEAIRIFCEQPGDPALVLAALGELASATGVDGMVGGQYVDVIGADLDAAGLRGLHALKTGRLISASVCVITILEAAGESETMIYRRFADELGVLFQIVDDILDVTQDSAQLGKTAGKDLASDKATWPAVHGIEASREHAAMFIEQAFAAVAPWGEAAAGLKAVASYLVERTH